MAKNWEKVEITFKNGKATLVLAEGASNRAEAPARKSKFDKTKIKSFDDLKKEGEKLYTKKVEAEDNLVAGLENNIIKSQALIKKAQNIVKKREEAAQKAAEKEAKRQRRDNMVDTNTAIA